MMFLQVRIGGSPKTRGPNKNIPSQVWNLTNGAFVSFLKLEQASGDTQPTVKKLSLQKKSVLTSEGTNRLICIMCGSFMKKLPIKLRLVKKMSLTKGK